MKPQRIEIFPSGEIGVVWSDGREDYLSPFELRGACPCALCQDESRTEDAAARGDAPQDVRALDWKPVGHYAVHFRWSDGHTTGMYPFELLRRLGERA